MIKKFSVENYKNFKDRVTLDFSEFKDYQYNMHALRNGLINTSIIYGKNASGKTNLGLAIFDITTHLVDKQINPNQLTFNINADSDKLYSIFEYEFILNGEVIRYGYQKDQNNSLVYEELFINDKKAFSYNFISSKGDFSGLSYINAENISLELRDMTLSVVRFIANNINIKESSVKDLVSFVDRMLWFRSVENNSYIGFKKGIDFMIDNIIKNGQVTEFQKFLSNMGVNHKLDVATDALGGKMLVSLHQNQALPFWTVASSGTKALTLFFFWKSKFTDISFLFVDEFDAFYHTELSFKLVEEVAKYAPFQTVFTTHNTSIMTNRLLRPDNYFIISQAILKPLYKCTERDLREGHNLEKMYKSGEFIE